MVSKQILFKLFIFFFVIFFFRSEEWSFCQIQQTPKCICVAQAAQ